jgi:CheY-like chemotaxis protein
MGSLSCDGACSAECGNLQFTAQVTIDANGRILVVDDDALIRDTLATALGDEGYAVRVAQDGRAALDTIGHWQPDVIVLDLMMPVMDGPAFRAAQRAAIETAHIPVIVLSAAHEVQVRAAALDAAAVFAKPFDLTVLLDTIAGLVESPRRQSV